MTTPVNGPADVKPGDLVEVHDEGVAAVVKATAARLTYEHDGKAASKAYTRKERNRGWTGPRETIKQNFHRLTAWDRWHRASPKTPDIGSTFGFRAEYTVERIKVRTRPDDVCAQIHALSAWLKSEPAKDEP